MYIDYFYFFLFSRVQEANGDHVSCLEKELADTKLVVHNVTIVMTECRV